MNDKEKIELLRETLFQVVKRPTIVLGDIEVGELTVAKSILGQLHAEIRDALRKVDAP